MVQEDLLFELARSIQLLAFESRKDVQTIFSHVLRFKPAHSKNVDPPIISYIVHTRPEIIVELCRGYGADQSAMPCGAILREALKFDVIAAIVLYDQSEVGEPAVRLTNLQPGIPQTGKGVLWKFFEWIDRGSFEVSSDAFATFRVRVFPDPRRNRLALFDVDMERSTGDLESSQTPHYWIPGD